MSLVSPFITAIRYGILLGAFGILCAFPAAARNASSEAPLQPESHGIQITTNAAPKIATVGDRIQVDIAVSTSAGYEVLPPSIGKEVGDFSILEFTPQPAGSHTQSQEKNPASSIRIIAAVYKTGIFTFPPVELQIRTREGNLVKLASAPVKIEIRSVLPAADRNLKDLKGQEEIPESRGWLWLLAIAAVLVALAALGIFWWKRRRSRKPVELAVPHMSRMEAAEAELRSVLTQGLLEAGKVKEFYVRLSDAEKKILEAGYGIQTAEKTTSEIMEDLRRIRDGSPDEFDLIESFLVRCDLVKFARYSPSADENQAVGKDALAILEYAKNRLSAKPEIESVL